MVRLSLWLPALLALCLTLGATRADAQGSSKDAATTIRLDRTVSEVHLLRGGVHWWKFTLTSTSLVTIEATGETDTQGKLEDSAGATLDIDDDGGAGANFKIVRVLGAGAYYVRVAGYSSATTGNYRPSVTTAALSTAAAITLGTAVSKTLAAGGVDYYRLALTSRSAVTVQTTGSTDVIGLLQDSAGAPLEANDDSGAGDNFRIDRTLDAGAYYVRVSGFNPTTTGSYSLSVTRDAAPTNSRGTATDITLGRTESRNLPKGGVHWWKFTLLATSLVTINTNKINTQGKLEDSAGNTLDTDADSATGFSGAFKIVRVLGAGAYYIRVSGFSSEVTGNYDLTVTAAATTIATAITLGGDAVSKTLAAGGFDYYRFALTSTLPVVIETTGSIDVRGLLQDSAGARIEANDDSGAGDNFRIDRVLDAGAYYVRVAGFNPVVAGDYSLSVTHVPNSAPTGAPIANDGSDPTEDATTVVEDTTVYVFQGTLNDDDGTDLRAASLSWQQAAPVNNAAPADDSEGWSDIPGWSDLSTADIIRFIPLQAQVGKYVRACLTFTDEHFVPETSTVCTASKLVTNVSDAPAGRDTTVDVPDTATAANPHDFDINDFPIDDEDGDTINGIRLVSLPTTGTLAVAGETLTLTAGATLTLAQLEALAYYPDSGSSPMDGHDSFDYRIIDDGSGAANISEDAYTLTINLFANPQIAATGGPSITPATSAQILTHAEDTELTANTVGIMEPNGIDQSTLRWQWQSAPAPVSGAPTESAYIDIATATAAAFTPLQAHVGLYIRVCVSFMDEYVPAAEYGPLCSAAARVRNVNDAPVAQNRTINVSADATMSEPYTFAAADFSFADGDHDNLASVEIASLPSAGTLQINGADAPVGGIVPAANIGTITYWPAAEQDAQTGYATFDFKVTDDGNDGNGNKTSATAAITINLAERLPQHLRLRLRLFLEGPLR